MKSLLTYVRETWGKELSVYSDSFLIKTIDQVIESNGLLDTEAYLQKLKEVPLLHKQLFEALHVHYSVFFRDPLVYAAIGQILLQEMLVYNKGDRRLRIWSTCCSSGEEPYSLSILLNELDTDNRKVQGDIFATDIDGKMLEIAAEGSYPYESLCQMPFGYVDRYFTKKDNKYNVTQEVKSRVHFSKFDLLDNSYSNPPDSIYGGFDLIVCSNVLYYYNPEQQKKIIRKLMKSIRQGGFLITDEVTMGSGLNFEGLEQFSPIVPVYKVKKLKESL